MYVEGNRRKGRPKNMWEGVYLIMSDIRWMAIKVEDATDDHVT